MFCVLDDARTRAKGCPIQWARPLREMHRVEARDYRPGVGLLNIGLKKNWLYSKRLHPVASRLEEEVRGMVARAEPNQPGGAER